MYAQVMGLGTIISGFGEKIKNLLSVFSGFHPFRGRIKINPRIVMIITAAILVIVVLLLILAVVSRSKAGSKQEKGLYEYALDPIQREKLPAEDFFLPYEPDFVPDVLLEREPKESWTEEDARPFWTNPLEDNESVWRKRIESEMDSLMEHVP